MEELEHSLFIVEIINRFIGQPLAGILSSLGIKIANPEHLFPDYLVMVIIRYRGRGRKEISARNCHYWPIYFLLQSSWTGARFNVPHQQT